MLYWKIRSIIRIVILIIEDGIWLNTKKKRNADKKQKGMKEIYC